VATSLTENIQKVTAFNRRLAQLNPPYLLWRKGMKLNHDGPPAWAVDRPAPKPEDVESLFCAGLGCLNLRLVGLPVPKNRFDRGYDGGMRAWDLTYSEKYRMFSLVEAEEGDVAIRPYQWGGTNDQGHWCYVGPGKIAMQCFAVEGMNDNYSLSASHFSCGPLDGYVYLLKAKDWLTPKDQAPEGWGDDARALLRKVLPELLRPGHIG
jgi:hypothetical protein